MKKKLFKNILFITIVAVLVTGCGDVKLKNGEKASVSIGKSGISSNEYYNEIKKNSISKLVDMIDHKILDKKYPSDNKENKEVENQIKQMKSNYSDDKDKFLDAIRQYFGVESEKELESMLRLEYKRSKAITDHVSKKLTKAEINKYYNSNINGEIKASHILIKSKASAKANDLEKKKAEEKAKAKAEKIIKELDSGKDFKKLAKKYSDDSSNKNDGGNLGYFNPSDMDENFAKAVKALEKGKYTKEPVKTQFGYHIILKIDEKGKTSLKSVEKKIRETLTQQKLLNDPELRYNALIEIRKENHVEWKDKELKKAYDNFMDQLKKSAKSSSNQQSQ